MTRPKKLVRSSHPRKRRVSMSSMASNALTSVKNYFNSIDECDYDDHEDAGSADAHGHKTSRQLLKNRSRHETANNSWLKGITRTTKNDMIGTGPRIQITDERFDDDQRLEIAKKFNQWMKDIKYAAKLRTQMGAKRDDGEGMGIAFDIPDKEFNELRHVYRNPLQFTYRVLDCDRFTDPSLGIFDKESGKVDGVTFNQFGDPISYQVLKQHPGDEVSFLVDEPETVDIPSKFVFHMFDVQRPEQSRGIPENQPSLSLATLIRKYTDAVVRAMRNASTIGGYLKTDLEPLTEIVLTEEGDPEVDEMGEVVTEQDCPEAGETFEIDPDAVQCLPRGYDYAQHETPRVVTSHTDFIHSSVTQIGRDGCMPRHKSTGDSSNYNYASVRSDSQDWRTCIKISRGDIDWDVTRLFILWWERAQTNRQIFSEDIATIIATDSDEPLYPEHKFHWDGFPHVDPNKEAKAQTERLRNATDSLYDVHAAKGQNWDEQKVLHARSLGVDVEEYLSLIRSHLFPKVQAPDNAGIQNILELVEDLSERKTN